MSNPIPSGSAPVDDCITRRFGKPRVVLPVIHYANERDAKQSIRVAVGAEADGVLMIPWGGPWSGCVAVAEWAKAKFPSLAIGANGLGSKVFGNPLFELVWTDPAIVDLSRGPEADQSHLVPAHEGQLWFGGAAFKTQPRVSNGAIPGVMRTAARWMDCPTTSGDGTGIAIDPAKAKLCRESMPANVPLAVASGISPDNVSSILPYVSAYIVATGIESRVGLLDQAKTSKLVELVHADTAFEGR